MTAFGRSARGSRPAPRRARQSPRPRAGGEGCAVPPSSRLATEMPTSVMPSRSIVGIAAARSSSSPRGWSRCSPSSGRGLWSVAREKSSKRSRSMTVRPTRPPAHRARDALDQSDRDGVDRVGRPEPGRARRDPIEPRRRRGLNPAGVAVVGERVELPSLSLAEVEHERPSGRGCDSPTVPIPSVRSLLAVTSPTPQSRSTGGVEETELAVRRKGQRPSGLATPLATFARNFVRATPTVIGRPTRSRTATRNRARDLHR